MSTLVTTNASERSTYVVAVSFTDENGANVTPNSGLTWSLYNYGGTVINSRADVSIAAAGTVNIVLSGADLDYDDGDERYLLVKGTYASSLGTALPLNDEVRFRITDLVGV